jgi:hypothetical protein
MAYGHPHLQQDFDGLSIGISGDRRRQDDIAGRSLSILQRREVSLGNGKKALSRFDVIAKRAYTKVRTMRCMQLA